MVMSNLSDKEMARLNELRDQEISGTIDDAGRSELQMLREDMGMASE